MIGRELKECCVAPDPLQHPITCWRRPSEAWQVPSPGRAVDGRSTGGVGSVAEDGYLRVMRCCRPVEWPVATLLAEPLAQRFRARTPTGGPPSRPRTDMSSHILSWAPAWRRMRRQVTWRVCRYGWCRTARPRPSGPRCRSPRPGYIQSGTQGERQWDTSGSAERELGARSEWINLLPVPRCSTLR